MTPDYVYSLLYFICEVISQLFRESLLIRVHGCVCLPSVCSGIGLALCERLLTEDTQLWLCLACRNMQRAEAARSALLTSHAGAHVDLLQLDVGSVESVLNAAKVVKSR